MAINDIYKTLEELSNADGIASREGGIRKIVEKHLKPLATRIEVDNIGSIAVIKEGQSKGGPKVMFASHMDEVGFIITRIEKNGQIKFNTIGGWWAHVMLSQIVNIHTRDGKKIKAVVGSTPPHILSNGAASQVQKMDTIFFDIGAKTDEEVKAAGIKPGDWVTPEATLFRTAGNENRVLGKAMDDRACLAMGIEVFKAIAKEKIDCDFYFVGTVQEEVGLRGAKTAAQKWAPDVAFGVDVTIAGDNPGATSESILGSGVALSIMDSSTIANPHLLRYMEDLATKKNIKFAYDAMTGGGTDTGQLHLAHGGVVAMTISIPAKYIHSHYGMVDLSDLEEGIKLMVEFIKAFNKEEYKKVHPSFN